MALTPNPDTPRRMCRQKEKEKKTMDDQSSCNLESWQAAECPKLGPTFKLIVEKVTEADFLLNEWVSEPGLSHELQRRIWDIMSLMNAIPPLLGDLGFDYVGTKQYHQDVLEALKVPELSATDIISLKGLSHGNKK
jgi:hypothetical protein